MILDPQKFNINNLNKLSVYGIFKIPETIINNPDDLIQEIKYRADLQVLEYGNILVHIYYQINGTETCSRCESPINIVKQNELIVIFGEEKANNRQAKKVSKSKFKKSGRAVIEEDQEVEFDYLIEGPIIDLLKPVIDQYYLERPISSICDFCSSQKTIL